MKSKIPILVPCVGLIKTTDSQKVCQARIWEEGQRCRYMVGTPPGGRIKNRNTQFGLLNLPSLRHILHFSLQWVVSEIQHRSWNQKCPHGFAKEVLKFPENFKHNLCPNS